MGARRHASCSPATVECEAATTSPCALGADGTVENYKLPDDRLEVVPRSDAGSAGECVPGMCPNGSPGDHVDRSALLRHFHFPAQADQIKCVSSACPSARPCAPAGALPRPHRLQLLRCAHTAPLQ